MKKINPRVERLKKAKAEKKKHDEFLDRKWREGDKSIGTRLYYKKHGVAKIHRVVEREAKSLNGRNAGEIINYPVPKWAKAKFRVNENHRVEQSGKDYFRVTRDLKILYADGPEKYPALFYPETLKTNKHRS